MTERIDLEPVGTALLTTVEAVEDDHLGCPTPCFGHTVAEMLQHLVTVTRVAQDTAMKRFGPTTEVKVHPDEWPPLVEDDWRELIAAQVPDLVDAWRDESAWEGVTQAGGLDLPGEMAGRIVVDELVLHGWDLARAIGREHPLDEDRLASAYEGLLGRFDGEGAPPGQTYVEAPVMDRLVVLSGRDPHWSPR